MEPLIIVALISFATPIVVAFVQNKLNKVSSDSDVAKKMAESAAILIEPYKTETVELRKERDEYRKDLEIMTEKYDRCMKRFCESKKKQV